MKVITYSTKNTITDFSKLEKELLNTRRMGIAVKNEDFEVGTRCVGVPIEDSNGKIIAAMNASGP